ncbi:MAG TPA: PHP domain-containing protein, partial [Nitrospirota bacterium]
MKFRIDLHVHSRYSTDNDSDPEETILRAIERGLHGIAFTEHYYYAASEPVEALREKYRGRILILRGVEFSTLEGHCLVFGADTDKMGIKYAPIKDVVRIAGKAGGVVIPSHPFRPGTSLGNMIWSVDGISGLEGCNGANMHAYNVMAIEAAESLKLPYTGGSDAHEPQEVGSCFTEFDDAVTSENFIELLKAGRYRGI